MKEVICPFKVTECDHYCGLHTTSGCSLRVIAMDVLERKKSSLTSKTLLNSNTLHSNRGGRGGREDRSWNKVTID